MQRPGFLEACLAVDAARLHLPVMHRARLFGKGRTDILGIRLHMGAKTFDERVGLLALAEPWIRIAAWLAAPLLHRRRHRRLPHHPAAAVRANNGARRGLDL